MHSRIFQLTLDPLDSADFLNAYSLDYDHWLFQRIADYAGEDENRQISVQWLKESLTFNNPHIEWREDSFILHEGFLASFFATRYERFKQQLAELARGASLDSFVGWDVGRALLELSRLEEDEYGFYVYDELGDIVTLDSFLRNAELDTPYYIGGTVDYHY